jgi:5-formyltetrahydrofolate cyclo-ligase
MSYNSKVIRLANIFFQFFDLTSIEIIHIFLPIRKQHEINTWLIIQKIFTLFPHITLLTSRSNLDTYQMENYLLKPDSVIKENRWGIPEPDQATPYLKSKIDLVLIPLLAFDRQGFRVGYGKGFYDRFLSPLSQKTIKIGLSNFTPVERIEDINKYDVKMDFCVTTEQVWHFSQLSTST